MNERIRELMLEAGFTNAYADPREGFELVFVDEEHTLESVTKFAQLIALECARLAMTQHHSTSPDDYDDMEPYEQGCDDTASVISGLIRRTFGV